MSKINLIKVSVGYAEKILEYKEEFSDTGITYIPERIPGLDYLEKYDNVHDWIDFCGEMSSKITWYMSVRESDDRIIGFIVLRHKLEYHDDDTDILRIVADNIDGGLESIQKRWKRYDKAYGV
mgnify:CR=1 FL=1